MQRVTGLFEQYVKLCQSLNYETMIAAVRMEDPAKLTDTIAANLQLSIEEKQELLEIFDPAERLNRIGDVLDIEIEKLNMDRTIQSRVKRQMERAQKEYYLNEKIKAIQKELGRGEKSEFDELKKKIDAAGMPGVRVLGDASAVRVVDASGVVVPGGDRVVAVVGLDDVVVVDTPDALLVMSRDRAQDVKAVVDALRAEGRTDLL